MSSAHSTADRVRKIIGELLNIDLDGVRGSATLSGDLAADSLDLVEIAMDIEDEFAVSVSDDEIAKFVSIDETVAWVEKKLTPTCGRCNQAMPTGCAGMFQDEGPPCLRNHAKDGS